MKYGKVIWGLILIIIGIMIILRNMGLFYFHWLALFRLWPLLFIFWGISVLPFKDWIKLILGLITLLTGIYLFRQSGCLNKCHDYEYNKNISSEDWSEQVLSEPYNSNISEATLKLTAAAGSFVINDTTSSLIYFNKKGNIGNYNMGIQKQGDSSTVIRIELDNNIRIHQNNKGNDVKIKLNPLPIWDMDFDIGAAEVNFDLTGYRTKAIEVDGGAASANIKLGDKFYRTALKINTGASSISVSIPKASGCEVKSETFLVDKDLPGFRKEKSNIFKTENFNDSPNKIYITIDAAISSFRVIRY